MAILDLGQRKNGIQMGGPLDYCEICANKNGRVDYGKLEYEEVFKMYRNGTSTCLCMEHFKGMLDHYLLVDINEEFEEEMIESTPEEEKKEEEKKEIKKEKNGKSKK